MAVARRSYDNPFEDYEQDPIGVPALPFTSDGGGAQGNDAPEMQDMFELPTSSSVALAQRLPADVSLMSVKPKVGTASSSATSTPARRTTTPIASSTPYPQDTQAQPTPMPQGVVNAPQYQGGGIDLGKWMDPAHDSVKYSTLRIFDSIPPAQARAQLAAGRGPLVDRLVQQGFQVLGDDTIYRQDVGVIDPIHGDNSEYGWRVVAPTLAAYQTLRNGGKPAASGGGKPAAGSGSGSTIGGTAQGPRLDYGYAGPGGAGVMDPTLLQQMGQDPMSQQITAALMGMLNEGGQTPFGTDLEETLRGEIGRGGQLDNDNLMRRFESARELMYKAKRSQLNDTRADLADRGLVTEPGDTGGPELGAVRRIDERIAPDYAREIRNIVSDEAGRSDDRLTTALTLATGMAQSQAQNILQAAGAGTDRQQVLANIALDTLAQNADWNKFLATYGLNRDRLLYELQNNNSAMLIPMLTMFQRYLDSVRGGHV